MTNRYGDAPIIYTRVGVCLDTLLDIGKKYSPAFSRDQFVEFTGLKASSVRDKLRDMALYGLIQPSGGANYTITNLGLSIINVESNRRASIEYIVKRSQLWDNAISNMGLTPDRSQFEKFVRSNPSLKDIDNLALDNLWSAFNADIGCINKNPPYATRKVIDRSNKTPSQPNQSEKPRQDVSSFKITPNILKNFVSNEKLFIEFGSLKFEVNDRSTAAIAKLLIHAKEQGLQFGEDYVQNNVITKIE